MTTVLYFYEGAFTLWRRRLQGVCAYARRAGWHIEPVNIDNGAVDAKRMIAFWKPAGALVDGGVLGRRGFGADCFSGLPVVYCDPDRTKISGSYYGVCHESGRTALDALRELLSLDCASYAYVHYHTRRDWSLERERLFRAETDPLGRPAAVFDSCAACRRADISVFLERLTAFLVALPRPCGVLAANDEMAAQVLLAASRAGVKVPREMAVVGIDNDELICENTHPTLTSVAPDFERSGFMAAELLAQAVKRPPCGAEVRVYGASGIVRRRSARAQDVCDGRVAKALEFIRRNACSGVPAAEVIRQMGMKPRTAELRFRQACGHSIRDEIMAVRLSQAKRLLADTDLPVAQVGGRCGYADERSLRYLFAKATGLSPNDWRRRNRDL